MFRYRFGQDDLLRTRFAIAPLMELAGAYDAVRDPRRYAVHAPWAARVAPRLTGVDLSLLEAAVPLESDWHPDFVSPPPNAPHAVLAEELDRVCRTPPAQVALEIARAYPDGVPAHARPLIDRPSTAIPGLADQMRVFWNLALADVWPRVLALVETEIAWRARRLAAVGPQAAFAGLHDTVRWTDGAVELSGRRRAVDLPLGGRGLLLVPAAFSWPAVWPLVDAPWQPTLVYPPPGVADLWAPAQTDDEALGALLGRGRARILLALERPAATDELARRLEVSAGGVSAHLQVLRRAGLVTGRREGHRVVYARTGRGDVLCGAA
ncbi:helix-turn-helix domain-containing protein [Paraconexibacter algicola]|uniref:Transcriptional regulator n=1 Tax=Paraconexibacter algicola TaxID=2133960 RepID=A0A2T4UBJ2_9ACTN|nr:helix-turn-helix domain-containing protein [Paraconexibacter algicola]PTL54266.1 transcriptional regulator [Paraconexibacter algicola]